MSAEHEPNNPRLDPLLRQIVAADLGTDQNARVRARLGLTPQQPDTQPTLTLPASRPTPIRTQEQDGQPMIATTTGKLRQQWLQFALAAIAFIAVGVVLAMVFGSDSDDGETRPGRSVDPSSAVQSALAPLSDDQERRLVLDVEAHGDHDNAVDQWTIELWQHWSAAGELTEGLYVSNPSGEVITHIVLDGQAPLLNWEPSDALEMFDVPLEYSLQRKVLGAALSAVNDPESNNLRSEVRDGHVVLTYEWRDDNALEFNFVNRGEAWIDPQTGTLQRIVHLVDRPDQDPYPTRTFTIRDLETLPIGSSPAGTYQIDGVIRPPESPAGSTTATTTSQDPSALPTPDGSGAYRGITIEQARQLVPFKVVYPEQVPDGFEPPELTVVELRIPSLPGARDYQVEMVYELSGDESPPQSVKFTQVGPNAGGLQLAQEESRTSITANGVEVTRLEGRSIGGDPILAYEWEHDGLGYMIFSTPAGDLTPELVDALMQDIFAIYTPTVESESARVEQERAQLAPFPVPDICAVTDWVGPDFRVGQQYASAYFLDGDGLSLGTTHGLIFGGENQISWFSDGPLTTSEALSGPGTIQAVQPGNEASAIEISIEVIEQIDGGGKDPLVERAWWTNVYFPSSGCWELSASLGQHSLTATVYVYPPPDTSGISSGISYDEAQVEEIALADPRVQAVLTGHPHQVAQVGMWTGEWGHLIGGIVAISIDGTRNVEGEWFEHSFLDCETRPVPDPVVVPYRAEFAGVTEIHVLVDLSTEAVVVIKPFWDDGVSLVGEREFTGEYDEIRQCDSQD